jgi:type II secretory pathway pseudopilin PulG
MNGPCAGGCSSQSGQALVEMLVSTAIACTVIGVLLQFAASAQSSVRAQADLADLQQRLRVAAESIRADLLAAGTGLSHGAFRGSLFRSFAPIVPSRLGLSGADPEVSFYADRLSITYVPDTRLQTMLSADMAGPASPLAIDGAAPGCPLGACGFAAGDRALIFEPVNGRGAHEVFTVGTADATGPSLSPAAPLSRAYPAGSPVAAVVQRVYYLDRAARSLMLYDGNRSDLPLVDHVVDLRFTYVVDPAAGSLPVPPDGASSCAYAGSPPVSLLAELGGMTPTPLTPDRLVDGPICGVTPNRFDADLMRLRRIHVTIRLEAESAEFRGSGAAFVSRGTSVDGNRYVPDLRVTFDVTPRNAAVQ